MMGFRQRRQSVTVACAAMSPFLAAVKPVIMLCTPFGHLYAHL